MDGRAVSSAELLVFGSHHCLNNNNILACLVLKVTIVATKSGELLWWLYRPDVRDQSFRYSLVESVYCTERL